MKILKFSGIVVGIHLLALILIFANPGCSSSAKAPPAKSDTAAKGEPSPIVTAPAPAAVGGSSSSTTPSAPALTFNTDARYSPTRPGSPAATTLETEPVSNVTPATTYTVVSGDNPTVIAKKNHITLSELGAANNFNPNTVKLHPGQKLIIPAKTPAPAKTPDMNALAAPGTATGTTAAKAAPGVVKHVVKNGETLSGIAQKYGVTRGAIGEANVIPDPNKIPAGTELIIPGWKAPADKSGGRTQKSSAAPADAAAKTVVPPPSSTTTPVMRSSPPNEVPVIQVEEAPASK